MATNQKRITFKLPDIEYERIQALSERTGRTMASPFLGGFEAEYIKTNTVTPECGGQCNHVEARFKTKASPVQGLIKELLNMQ